MTVTNCWHGGIDGGVNKVWVRLKVLKELYLGCTAISPGAFWSSVGGEGSE